MTRSSATDAVPTIDELRDALERQRAGFLRDGAPDYAGRRANLARLKAALLARRQAFEVAVDADFGHRPTRETAIMDIASTIQGINFLSRNLRRLMRPRRRRLALHLLPASGQVLYQPLGVVGIMSPWNYPIGLTLMPLATALAAGNRAMLKPSELTPRTSKLIAELVAETFAETEVYTTLGGPEVGVAFSSLPFDHLLFTGSTEIGRKVHQAASRNLVPVTLELGGKSPVLIDRGFSTKRAAREIVFGKLANAGQTCIAPDYALVASEDVNRFVDAFKDAVIAAYPAGTSDDAFASIISDRHFKRLRDLIEDARAKGARIIEIGSGSRERTLTPTLVLDATADMRIMQEEIFGPILPVVPYTDFAEAVDKLNARPRPLALYIFSDDKTKVAHVLARTTSGNVTVNDTMMHYAADELPFGGIGPSGMGAYHGEEGFRTFSHAKGVFTQSKVHFAGLVRAPFGRLTDVVLAYLLR